MKIPLKYSYRSLWVRRVGTIMTILGIGLTVAIVVVMLAMIHGLDRTFTVTGDEQNLIVIREGSQNEVNSIVNLSVFDTVRTLPGIQRDDENQPMAAAEIVVVINHPRKSGMEGNLMFRGTSDMGFKLRPGLQIVRGRRFREGLREIIVSESVATRFAGVELGDILKLSNGNWTVVGIFRSNGDAYDSEIWTGHQDIVDSWNRPMYSSILIRAASIDGAKQLSRRIEDDQRIHLNAVNQREYFESQTVSSMGLKALSFFIAVIMGIGSCFAIMNMMYGAVMSRQQEVATMRALGFRKRSILASFLAESALLGLLGGLVGCVMGSFFNGYSAGTSNFATFSEVVFNFQVTPEIILLAMGFATSMGILGGLLPSRKAATVRLIDVLRE